MRRAPLSRSAEIGIIAGFWIVVALLTIVQQLFDPRYAGQDSLSVNEALFTFTKYMIWVIVTPGIFSAIEWIDHIKSVWQKILLHCVTGVAVSAIIHYFYHMLWNALMPENPQTMSFIFVLSGLHFLPEFLLYLVVLAAGFARDYFIRYRERLRETARLHAESAELKTRTAELQAQLADARLRTLHMQINPHFLFNTLHTIAAFIERDPKGARRMISLLSELLRYALENKDVKEVPLKQELGFLTKYLDIQSIRFQNHLDVCQRIEPEVLDALVPNLILQPLVENAIKHGVSALESGGRIDVRAWREKDRLHVSICDNGPGLADSSGGGIAVMTGGIGLKNTCKRLESLYHDDQHFTLENRVTGGAEAHLSLPYHTRQVLRVSSLHE